MKLFSCSACRHVVFFENVRCTRCGHDLAFLPDRRIIGALELTNLRSESSETPLFRVAGASDLGTYKLCRNSFEYGVCNWAIPTVDEQEFCASCAFNTVIPNLAAEGALAAWQTLEAAKRRLLYTLMNLGLPLERRGEDGHGLAFSFESDAARGKVFTGHCDGLVTINVAEADAPFREKIRVELGERYRTVLGHFRHEIGHYYWNRLVRGTREHSAFRALFGDESADYANAIAAYHAAGAQTDWPSSYVTAYAASHPWEDFAETFSHYLHMVDAIETARSYGVAIRPRTEGGVVLPGVAARRIHPDSFDELVAAWIPLTIALNSFNRGLGLPDVYPFVLTERVVEKLSFVHRLVDWNARARAA